MRFMFGQRKEAGVAEKPGASANIIGASSTIRGEFQSAGSIRIEGALVGDVTTRSRLVMSEKALVTGNVFADSAEISGRVEGDVRIKGTLFLHEKAVIEGNIFTKRLVVELGAVFNGRCKMGDPSTEAMTKNKRSAVPEPLNTGKVP